MAREHSHREGYGEIDPVDNWPVPYFESDGIRLYHGDCRSLLNACGPLDVTCTIADPPYGDTSLEWDRWPTGWVASVAKATPRSAPLWCFGSMRMWLTHVAEFTAAGWSMAQDLVWEKHNGSSFHADRFKRVHEHALQWYRGDWSEVWREPVYTNDATKRAVRRKERPPHTGEIAGSSYRSEDGGPKLQRSVIYARSCHGTADHPTQKPEAILWPLLAYSLPPGATVLDPMAGAGSTLVAARAKGYRAIGIEADERYCEATARRLDQGVFDFGGGA